MATENKVLPSNKDELRRIGENLKQNGSGKSSSKEVKFRGNCSVHLYYLKAQKKSSDLVHLIRALFVLHDFGLLRSLCELSSLNIGKLTTWTCKSTGVGRLGARSSRSGCGIGVREKISTKVGCSSRVTTVFSSGDRRHAVLSALVQDLSSVEGLNPKERSFSGE